VPALYIITGSNGAGKSSIGPSYLPDNLKQDVFDGDKLFMQKRSDLYISGIRSHKECKKLAAEFVENYFDNLVESAINANVDFAYEGHFTNEATWSIPARFKSLGYSIHLLFFGLSDTTLSHIRVVARSNEGGHYVDPLTIRDNYFGNLEKLDKYFSMFDSVTLIDTSGIEHIGLAVLENASCSFSVPLSDLPEWFRTNLPKITEVIAKSKSLN
jgi:predicted ABC-type ATPase